MKNKIILIIFIVLIVGVCIMTAGCTLSNDSGNNSNSKSMDTPSKTEVDEDLSDKNNMEEITITENVEGGSSNIEAIESNNEKNRNAGKNVDEEDYKKTTSSQSEESSSIELSKDEQDKDKYNNNTSQNDNEDIEQITSTEQTESDGIGGGIVLPDDEW